MGFLEGELGLGEVARKLGRALERAEIPFAAIPYRRTPSRQEHPIEFELSRDAPFDTNLICLNADYLHTFLGDAGVDFFADRYSIGVWFWESSVLRQEHREGFRFLDEVWVASDYVRRAVAAEADVTVHVMPLPIDAPAQPTRSRAALGLPPKGFMFLFLFDFVSSQRKNPGAVVEAFKRAFHPGDGAFLVMKSINGRERKPQPLGQLAAAAAGRPDIHIVDGYLSAHEKEAVIAACDCYVSLHRSEGFGLTMAEAMAHGKPVIATGYSGNLEFMDEANGYLVPYRLVPVPEDWWAWAPGAEWAEPDVEAAAACMRRVYDDRAAAEARGRLGKESILDRLSLDRSARFVADRLDASRDRRPAGSGSPARDPRASILQISQELELGVGASLASKAGPGTWLVRRLLMRALWPYLAEQHRINTQTLDALTKLHRSLDDLSRRIADLEEAPCQLGGSRTDRRPDRSVGGGAE